MNIDMTTVSHIQPSQISLRPLRRFVTQAEALVLAETDRKKMGKMLRAARLVEKAADIWEEILEEGR